MNTPTGNTMVKSKCDRTKIVRISVKIVEWMIFAGLICGVGYFVQGVWYDYQSQETSIKQHSEKWDTITPPTITFCFNPPVKQSILEKYNLTFKDFFGFGEVKRNFNLSVVREALYRFGRDFNITEGDILQNLGENKNMKIEEIYTFWHGTCIKVTPLVKIKTVAWFGFVIEMTEDMAIVHLPKIDFYLTSEDNAYGIIQGQWIDGSQPLHIETNTKNNFTYDVNLEIFKYKKLVKVSNCSYTGVSSVLCGAFK